ncbi:MAG: alpha/beta hydrolase, partial [Candidatus Bipolaricaulota bacterium]|nr:alpha/beta hydrolase [Candidatus Bipolaricaulota bacterium]
VLLCGGPVVVLGSSSVPLEVRVVTPAQPGAVNPWVYGLNCAEMITKGLLDVPEYVEAIAELRLKTLQFPGGSASYWHHPTGAGGLNARPEEILRRARAGEASRWMGLTSGPDRFAQFLDLCRRSGAEAVFIANILHGNPEEMDVFLQRIRAAGVGIAAVVLGQEMHLSPEGVGLGLEEYLRRIGPHIELLREKYPGVPVAAPATPVGRVAEERREGLREWNQALAKVPGLDGFTQYGWTEFAGTGSRGQERPPEEGWPFYREFVVSFPTVQIPLYQRDFGPDKRFFMTQWGTHGDQNTPLQGVHLAHMYFFFVRYNAAHGDYFALANLSVPLAAVAEGGGRQARGVPYRERIVLLAPYLYTKPFRHLFDGQAVLLESSLAGAPGETQVLAARAGDGSLLLYFLNPGPRRPLGTVTVDGFSPPPTTLVAVEAAYAAPEGAGIPVAVFTGEKPLGEVVLEPWSLTLVRLAAAAPGTGGSLPTGSRQASSPAPAAFTTKEFIYKSTPQGALKLVVTFPADGRPGDRRPGVVFFSGGAWAHSLINQFKEHAEYFAGRGLIAVRVDYRGWQSHGTGPDKAVEDARSAMRWLRAHATELGLDPERLAAGGSSAGGHLAACTATPVAPDDPADDLRLSSAPNALLMINCVVDFREMEDTEKFRERVPGGGEMAARLSPILHLGPGWPPTLILDGDRDRWFGLAQRFVDILTSYGVRAELWIAPGEGHPFSHSSPWREAAIAKMDEFLASLGWLAGPPAIPVPPGAQWQRYTPQP